MARKDYLQRGWWYASEGQKHLEIGYQAFLTFIEAEDIRVRQLPGSKYPLYNREDIERAAEKYVSSGTPRVKGPSRRKKKTVEHSTSV